MIVLSGADLVLPDRIVPAGALVIDAGRIIEIRSANITPRPFGRPNEPHFAFHNHYIVPGFVDQAGQGEDLRAATESFHAAAILRRSSAARRTSASSPSLQNLMAEWILYVG
jgi:hypothetical protein